MKKHISSWAMLIEKEKMSFNDLKTKVTVMSSDELWKRFAELTKKNDKAAKK